MRAVQKEKKITIQREKNSDEKNRRLLCFDNGDNRHVIRVLRRRHSINARCYFKYIVVSVCTKL